MYTSHSGDAACGGSVDAPLRTSTCRVRLYWSVLDGGAARPLVRFKQVADGGNVWQGSAPAAARVMLNGPSGSGLATIGTPNNGNVGLFVLVSQVLSGIRAAAGPASSQISNASIHHDGSRSILKWVRPVDGSGDAQEHALNLNSLQGFNFAVGGGQNLAEHVNYGYFQVQLKPPPVCSRGATCSNRGSCPSLHATTCVCDAGYVGSDCGDCAPGFERVNSTSSSSDMVCALKPEEASQVKAAVSMRLLLDYSTISDPHSEARASFEANFTTEMADLLNITTDRIQVHSVTEGSIIVGFYILPAPNATGSSVPAPNVNSLAALLQNLAMNTSSPLYTSGRYSIAATLDPATPVSASFLRVDDGYLYSIDIVTSDAMTLTLSWSLTPANSVRMRLQSSVDAWAAIAFNPKELTMVGSDAIVIEPGLQQQRPPVNGVPAAPQVNQYTLQGTDRASVVLVAPPQASLDWSQTHFTPIPGGGWVAEFVRPLPKGGYPGAVDLPSTGSIGLVSAWGSIGQTVVARHLLVNTATGYIDLRTGTWGPKSSNRLAMLIAHAVMMFTAWAVLVPATIGMARYGRTLLAVPAAWFKFHRALSAAAWVLFTCAFGVAVAMVPTGFHFTENHHKLGLTIFLLGFLQPLNAFVRPPAVGPRQAKPFPRLVWEVVHKGSGYVVAVLAIAAVFTGLALAEAHIAFTNVYAAFVTVMLAGVAALEWQTLKGGRGSGRTGTDGKMVVTIDPPAELSSEAGANGSKYKAGATTASVGDGNTTTARRKSALSGMEPFEAQNPMQLEAANQQQPGRNTFAAKAHTAGV